MAVTPTIQNVQPVIGASADTWGGILNPRLQEAYADINALAVQGNASETAVAGALPKAGGTMTGDIGLADVAPGSALSVGFRGVPVMSIDADRTLLATDAGKMIRLTGTTARTWTIPPDVFPIGTAIVVRSVSTAALSIARGAGVTLRLVGVAANANRSMASQGQATLLQEALNEWSISGLGVS